MNGSFGGSNRLVLCSAVVFLAAAGVIGEALQSFSIVGLYITFVLAVGRFIRAQSSDLRLRIPFENLPNCDRYAVIGLQVSSSRQQHITRTVSLRLFCPVVIMSHYGQIMLV